MMNDVNVLICLGIIILSGCFTLIYTFLDVAICKDLVNNGVSPLNFDLNPK